MSIMLAAAMMIAPAVPAGAATLPNTYSFNIGYAGNDVTELLGGSVDPTTVSLNVGDSFLYTLTAIDGGFWTAMSDTEYFAALIVGPAATRIHSFDYYLWNDGALLSSGSDPAINSSAVHIGQIIPIAAGMIFDQITFGATLTQVTGSAEPSTIRELLPFSGAPDSAERTITFTAGAVPEPATWAMMMVGFGMIAAAARYRRRRTTVVIG